MTDNDLAPMAVAVGAATRAGDGSARGPKTAKNSRLPEVVENCACFHQERSRSRWSLYEIGTEQA